MWQEKMLYVECVTEGVTNAWAFTWEVLGMVFAEGQEKSLNSSHLCQKLRCLSSQIQEASAPGASRNRGSVVPELCPIELCFPLRTESGLRTGTRTRAGTDWSGTGAVALWSHFKGCPCWSALQGPRPLTLTRHRESPAVQNAALTSVDTR